MWAGCRPIPRWKHHLRTHLQRYIIDTVHFENKFEQTAAATENGDDEMPELFSDDDELAAEAVLENAGIVMEGMLRKRAQQKRRMTLRANIKQRWFRLTADTLTYYQCDESGESRVVRGAISTKHIAAVEALPSSPHAAIWMFEVCPTCSSIVVRVFSCPDCPLGGHTVLPGGVGGRARRVD